MDPPASALALPSFGWSASTARRPSAIGVPHDPSADTSWAHGILRAAWRVACKFFHEVGHLMPFPPPLRGASGSGLRRHRLMGEEARLAPAIEPDRERQP